MTDIELKKKAFEYRKELVPYTELGYPDVAIPVYEALDIDRAFVAGAKELEEENEQLQQKWLDSEYEKSKLVSQIQKMKCCGNCRLRGAECVALEHQGIICDKTRDKWELAE